MPYRDLAWGDLGAGTKSILLMRMYSSREKRYDETEPRTKYHLSPVVVPRTQDLSMTAKDVGTRKV